MTDSARLRRRPRPARHRRLLRAMLGGVLLATAVPGTASAPSAATLPAAAIFGIAGATEGEEILRIPLSEPVGLGAPAAFLEATLYRPAGAGPFPSPSSATAPRASRAAAADGCASSRRAAGSSPEASWCWCRCGAATAAPTASGPRATARARAPTTASLGSSRPRTSAPPPGSSPDAPMSTARASSSSATRQADSARSRWPASARPAWSASSTSRGARIDLRRPELRAAPPGRGDGGVRAQHVGPQPVDLRRE